MYFLYTQMNTNLWSDPFVEHKIIFLETLIHVNVRIWGQPDMKDMKRHCCFGMWGRYAGLVGCIHNEEFFTTAIHNSYIIKMYNYRGSNVAMIITIDDAFATHFTN